MLLADSNVWIDYLKGTISPQTDLLFQGIYKNDVVLGDLIASEMLQGIRDDSQFESVKESLQGFHTCTLLNPDAAITAANHYRLLRKKASPSEKLTMSSLPVFALLPKYHCCFRTETLAHLFGI